MAEVSTSMYNYYSTASDVKVFLSQVTNNKIMYLDKALGIGYSTDVSSVPIYTLGKATPAFFSHGNFLGQGVLVIPFTDERYLKTSLQYLFDELPKKSSQDYSIGKVDPTKLSDEAFRQAKLLSASIATETLNISTILSEFNIIINIDNSTAFKRSDSKSITLKGVKLISDSFEVNSQQDGTLQIGYKFLFKDISR